MGKTSDDSKRCRWPDCDCYSPIGPQTCRKAAPVTPMTDKAPERIHVGQFRGLAKSLLGVAMDADDEHDATVCCDASYAMMEAAAALEAAQARITGLEAEVSAWRQVRDAVAELEGLGPDWPSHGNAPLAVTSGYALHRQRAATARAEALEEAAGKAEREGVYPELNVWDGGPDWYKHGKRIAAAIRALKEKPNG